MFAKDEAKVTGRFPNKGSNPDVSGESPIQLPVTLQAKLTHIHSHIHLSG